MERRCGRYSVTNCWCNVYEDRCVDFRRSMCRLSKIDVSTFEDRCVNFQRSMCRPSEIDVDLRRSMCRPSKIEINVKLCCYTCSKHNTIVVCKLGGGFALQCFHFNCNLNSRNSINSCIYYQFELRNPSLIPRLCRNVHNIIL